MSSKKLDFANTSPQCSLDLRPLPFPPFIRFEQKLAIDVKNMLIEIAMIRYIIPRTIQKIAMKYGQSRRPFSGYLKRLLLA